MFDDDMTESNFADGRKKCCGTIQISLDMSCLIMQHFTILAAEQI